MVQADNETMEVEYKVGTPWSILPIKNKKYAKDLVDVNLSNRGITSLEKFEDFPNLEVIWLNGNEVSKCSCNFYNYKYLFSYKTWTISNQTSE